MTPPSLVLRKFFTSIVRGPKLRKERGKITKIPAWILKIQQVWFCWWGEDFSETESQIFTVFVKRKKNKKNTIRKAVMWQ